MKLIDAGKLREKLQECLDADGYLYGDEKQAAQNLLSDLPSMEVNPADLDLVALGVLEKIKGEIQEKWDSCRKNDACKPARLNCLAEIQATIAVADLESGLNLGEIRKLRVNADVLFRLCVWLEPAKRGANLKTKDVLDKIDEFLAQSRHELGLEAEGKEKGDKDECRQLAGLSAMPQEQKGCTEA